jgi:hypothetical protein
MLRITLMTILFLFLFSCSLSTEQEMSLNQSIINMVESRNQGDGLSYLNHTHPAVVKHYKSLGDSVLIQKFQEIPERKSRNHFNSDWVYWSTGYVKEVEHEDTLTQAKIEIQLYKNNKVLDSTLIFYATSFEGETDWLFAKSEDYYASYFPVEQRLFPLK